jgi:type I restriction enzyme S subunit
MNGEIDNLPKGWGWTTLGELASFGSGNPAPQGPEYFEDGVYPFVRVQDMGRLGDNVYLYDTKDHLNSKAVHNMQPFPKGSVLFTKSGMSALLNQRAVLGRDMYVVSHIGVSSPLGGIPSEWLYYWLKTIDFKNLTHATTLPSLQLSSVQAIDTPLPPLPEQHRIVAKIEEIFTRLDTGVEALRKIKAQLKRYRQALLKHAFEGKLTIEWRQAHQHELESASILLERIKQERLKTTKAKYRELPTLDTSALPELPECWVWAPLPALGELNRGKSKHRPRDEKSLFGGQYPFIQTGDVRNSGGLIKEYRQTYSEFGLQQSRLWPVNTLCITIAANIAETALLAIPACFPDSIVGFIAYGAICDVKYVYFFLRTVKDQLESYAPATAQKNINIDILRNVAVPIPSLLEQGQIVAEIERRFSVAAEIEKIVDRSFQQAERLRKSILRRAFEGKLVHQDPTDEPAVKLLERIKAERAKQLVETKAISRVGKRQIQNR